MGIQSSNRTPFERVAAAEREFIRQQREVRGHAPAAPDATAALALSGGGIRSASFALGVLQALARYEKLHVFDYLSTVSGGGYIGSALTWFNHLRRAGKLPPEFPFGRKTDVKRAMAPEAEAAAVATDNTAFIRHHGEYLAPAKELTKGSLVATLLRNALVSFSVYFALILGITLLLVRGGPALASALGKLPAVDGIAITLLPGLLLLDLFVVLALLFALSTWFFPRFLPDSAALYSLRIWAQRLFGLCFVLALALLLVGSVPHAYEAIEKWRVATLGTSSLIGLAGVAFEFYKQQRPALAALLPRLGPAIVWIASSALIYSVLLLAYAAAVALAAVPLAPWIALAYGGVFGFLINTNMFGLGRMYRDRLMEAFLPDPEAVARRRWQPAYRADVAFLSDVCTPADPGPYHLINANVVLTGSNYAAYRGRGGDNFVMSPLYCGADALGWHPTASFCGGKMSLATAMAISGAAVNPNAGCGGQGPTRNRLASFMLALFNIRLGYWVRNPNATPAFGAFVRGLWPSLLYPGLRQGLLGDGMHVRAGFVELTDGGHFDNTGLYELIRRRVDCIVLSLASADVDTEFADLVDLLQRVRSDFGTFIEFPTPFAEVMPGSCANPPGGIAAALKVSTQGHAVGTIKYPDGETGRLIVLKSVIGRDLPMDVFGYAAAHAAFPNESTADQFFDERQFEAYREAGYAVCKAMLAENKVQGWF